MKRSSAVRASRAENHAETATNTRISATSGPCVASPQRREGFCNQRFKRMNEALSQVNFAQPLHQEIMRGDRRGRRGGGVRSNTFGKRFDQEIGIE
jgi:hypothetical protein